MSRFKPFLLGTLAGAAVVYVSLQYHFVRSTDGFYLVQRSPQASLGLAYADIRGMSDEDLASYPELARAMTAHAARGIVAANSEESSSAPDAEPLDAARERLRSTTDDWKLQPRLDVPKPPPQSSLDAPIWNPFTEEPPPQARREEDYLGVSASQPHDDWPFNEASPFTDITDELDQARETFANRSRQSRQRFTFDDQNSGLGTTDPYGRSREPFDFTADSAPKAAVDPGPSRRVQPLNRDDAGRSRLKNSVGRTAREIYEESRRRSQDQLNSPDRGRSRSLSVIDELVSPRESEQALERSTRSATPQRYRRGN